MINNQQNFLHQTPLSATVHPCMPRCTTSWSVELCSNKSGDSIGASIPAHESDDHLEQASDGSASAGVHFSHLCPTGSKLTCVFSTQDSALCRQHFRYCMPRCTTSW